MESDAASLHWRCEGVKLMFQEAQIVKLISLRFSNEGATEDLTCEKRSNIRAVKMRRIVAEQQ